MSNVVELKKAVAAKLAVRSVDASGFRVALERYGSNFFRVVNRDRDAVDVAAGHYLPRRVTDAQASVQTTDILGMENYLMGRFATAAAAELNEKHPDFAGLDGPFDGKAETEIQQLGNPVTWVNMATGEVMQQGDALPDDSMLRP